MDGWHGGSICIWRSLQLHDATRYYYCCRYNSYQSRLTDIAREPVRLKERLATEYTRLFQVSLS